MHNRPDHPTLLEAVATFLMESVAPKLEADKALQFRVLIAANVVTTTAAEVRTEDERFAHEVRALEPLVSGSESANSTDRAMRGAALDAMNRELAQRLRAGALSEEQERQALEALLELAKATLRVTNPRFEP